MNTQLNTRICFSLLIGLGSMGCAEDGTGSLQTTPEAIRGVWTTEDAAYAGRWLEIQEGNVLFYTEEETLDPYVIQEVRVAAQDSGALYEIDHTSWEGGTLTLSIFVRAGDSTLVFENQPSRVWYKDREGVAGRGR
jgi:hypothetical protein